MKTLTFALLALIILTKVSYSDICTIFENNVQSAQNAFNNANKELNDAKDKLAECQNVDEIVKSDVYITAKEAAVAAAILNQTHQGINWNEQDLN